MLEPGFTKWTFSPVKVYHRPIASSGGVPLVPRATVGDDQAALASLRTETSVGGLVLAPETPASMEGQADSLFRRGSSSPERLIFERVDGQGGGYLVVDDAWFPGWRAEVDGLESPVLRANVYFKAVWVPEGARRVELAYEPYSLRLGAAISVGALAIVALLLIRGRLGGRA